MLAIGNAVQFALSSSRAEFKPKIHKIEGKINEQGGGLQGSLSSGIAVDCFAIEIEAELRNRGQVAREALGKAIDSQELRVSRRIVKQLKVSIRKVWDEETRDLSDWYQRRVSVNNVIATERPFESSAEAAFQGVFVEIENKALVPGFLAQLRDGILNLVIERLVFFIVGIIIIVVLFFFRELLL
ncbi:MAG: hypothetical protein O7G29_13915 [Acidobacteria bacterium]|nr:hypothetical protein [Acidobacteriota bacterium]